jgi:hypothetical protein
MPQGPRLTARLLHTIQRPDNIGRGKPKPENRVAMAADAAASSSPLRSIRCSFVVLVGITACGHKYAPSESLQEVVTIPEPVEREGVTDRDHPVDAAAVEYDREFAQLISGEAFMAQGLITAIHAESQINKPVTTNLIERARATKGIIGRHEPLDAQHRNLVAEPEYFGYWLIEYRSAGIRQLVDRSSCVGSVAPSRNDGR